MKRKAFNREKYIIHKLIKKEIFSIQNHYLDNRAILIESLKIVQKYYGWVSQNSLIFLSKLLKIPISNIESVATFYSQIFRTPVGRYVIKFCDSMVCYVNGYKKVKYTLEKILKIKCGETTKDKNFTLLPICCLGACDRGPVVMINNKTYFFITEKSIIKLLDSLEHEK
ncbi:NADH-quinone oxidoreductase subunit NuoE [Buchnera aphidicola]|uniref:NADH-quinone oxidoreductase subunit NuoE n=1 Tax=Buchnera aphidicola TaxID=9 RepID=UPI002092E757|nr:NADH-quinone oxidoreductase subunit NuoE [Buchnera aphidicola]USS94238.1 NADH-quinone oxidoreductase subunit NuoE [Buchnera aphidicola (Sipha maydis)]WII23788.1 NADH-quinone oxidoreductase subunit NuoE [Buchnera aphidicola (Sipha maydis)]